jgi:hypothetical protein
MGLNNVWTFDLVHFKSEERQLLVQMVFQTLNM